MTRSILISMVAALGAGVFCWKRASSPANDNLAEKPLVEVPAGYEVSGPDLLPVTLERISSWEINTGMSLETLRRMYPDILPVDETPLPDAGDGRMEHYIVMLRQELESDLSYQGRQKSIPPSPDSGFVLPEIITRNWRSWKLTVSVTGKEAEKKVTCFSIDTDP